jgi:TRAP-type C4-dicarboxylate transport system substrate-binding protein
MVIGKSLYDKLSKDLQQIFAKANLDQIKWNYHNLAEKKPYQLYIAAF